MHIHDTLWNTEQQKCDILTKFQTSIHFILFLKSIVIFVQMPKGVVHK